MSVSTLSEFRTMLAEAEQLSDTIVRKYLNDAKTQIEALGYSTTHARFSEMQRYRAAHLMSIAGIAGKDVVSESVADVSRTYANGQQNGNGNKTSWERELNKIRTQIEGVAERCL
jgi:hypothetical protein